MKARSLIRLFLISAAFGAALTGFYFVHESLPRAIRAPTSLILAPVAVVDGLSYAIGVAGIYGRPVPVFFVNWAFAVVVCCGLVGVKRWWGRRKAATSDPSAAEHIVKGNIIVLITDICKQTALTFVEMRSLLF